MEILKAKISEEHNNAAFYTGIIAYGRAKNGKAYVLRSESEAEITLFGYNGVNNDRTLHALLGLIPDGVNNNDKHFYAADIEKLGLSMTIDDDSLKDYNCEGVSVLVDGWLTIAEARGTELEGVLYSEDQDEERIFSFYDEAIERFKKFLEKE